MAVITIKGYKCERCSHIWTNRNSSSRIPIVCPSCKSPYWNLPRKNNSKGGNKK